MMKTLIFFIDPSKQKTALNVLAVNDF